jgi:hypothetical protein
VDSFRNLQLLLSASLGGIGVHQFTFLKLEWQAILTEAFARLGFTEDTPDDYRDWKCLLSKSIALQNGSWLGGPFLCDPDIPS